MFKRLKDKLKGALKSINKKVEEEIPDEKIEVVEEIVGTSKKKAEKKKKTKQKKEVKRKTGKTEAEKTVKEEVEVKDVGIEEVEEVKRKGLFGKIKQTIVTKRISEEKFSELFSELEMILLENNVALEIVDKIKVDLKESIVDKPIKRSEISEVVANSLRDSIKGLFDVGGIDVVKEIKKKKEKPYVICFFGVNGSGKTTTIAKLANFLMGKGLKVLLVAGDTWRAASIQQLEEHGKKLNARVIKHNYGSDPAAVAFDGVKAAKANKADAVIIDTAGRQHSNKDLMRELEKIVRVAEPDLKIFVGESITGNDCIMQAQEFGVAVDIDGLILTKADVDDKGGAAISIEYVTGKPILFIGNGQGYDDLEKFDSEKILNSLGI
tara:strand:- start:4097 stop:5236 length:1140 start_codon:yes stop_codon:yes gene_type:complete